MIIKRLIADGLQRLSKKYPVITVTGPRQSGKTTLVKMVFPKKTYFSLEDPDVREMALSDPRAFLEKSKNGAILDEIQKVPELLSYIQTMVDEKNRPGMYILTGSQQLDLRAKVNQSLAGRTALLKLLPLSIEELSLAGINSSADEYLLKGFYPRIYDKHLNPTETYKYYFETYIQRDLRQLINIKDLRVFRKFVKLCAGRAGQIFVSSTFANELGVSVPTINSWISILEASYIVFLLEPYHENIGKRLTKSPKLYFYDVGIASYLLGISDKLQLERDPMRGHLIENLVVIELLKKRYNRCLDHNLFFYRDSNQNEIDVIYKSGNELIPFEIKSSQTYNSDFLKGLNYIVKIFPNRIKQGYLVYTGKNEQELKMFKLVNFRNVFKYI